MSSLQNFVGQYQRQTLWCWAAVAAAISDYFQSGGSSQCTLVNTELNKKTCCLWGGFSNCNQTWWLDRVLSTIHHLNRVLRGKLPLVDINHEISASRPIGVRIAWSGGSHGHFCTLIGCSSTNIGTGYVLIVDPEYGWTIVSLASMGGRYRGCGDWDWTYLTK